MSRARAMIIKKGSLSRAYLEEAEAKRGLHIGGMRKYD